jgi:hypothetical protein
MGREWRGTTIGAVAISLLVSGCDGGAGDWATRRQIIEAAERCGVAHFKPTKAGAGWAAYVRPASPETKVQEDCIYADTAKRGLLVTR